MAKKVLKDKALKLRASGMSYSEIKKRINVSKSTLSLWLQGMPLSQEKIRELRDNNPRRIERYRDTMFKKKEQRLKTVYKNVGLKIDKLSERDLFIGGVFLYMGEGSKTTKGTTALTNTNPHILKLFIKWLYLFNVQKKKVKVQLHLYSDMDIEKQINFWSKELSIPRAQFRKPHIKKIKYKSVLYKGQFGQGTCTVLYEDVELYYATVMSLKYIQDISL